MTPGAQFPVGSARWAVAVYGNNWGLSQEPSEQDVNRPNWVFRAERHDAAVMRRCLDTRIGVMAPDRGTVWDPRVWVGVPLLERQP